MLQLERGHGASTNTKTHICCTINSVWEHAKYTDRMQAVFRRKHVLNAAAAAKGRVHATVFMGDHMSYETVCVRLRG